MHNANKFHEGCVNVAQSLGMRIEPFWIGGESMTAKRLDDILYNRGIQGAIFLPTGNFRGKMNHAWDRLAAVSYGIYDITPGIDRVKADHYGNMEKVINILTEQNFTRIGFIMDIPYPYKNNNRWLAAYLLYLHNLPARKRLSPWLDPSPDIEKFQDWLNKEQPDVIICIDAEKVKSWLEKLGYNIPKDISLVTLSTAREGKVFCGIVENSSTCGKLAMEMLLDRIHHNQFGPPDAPHYVTVRGRWTPGTTLRTS